MVSRRGVPRARDRGEFAHTLVPIIVGYFVAHYWSLLVIAGQQTFIQLSDPLGGGANWLGTGDNEVDATLARGAARRDQPPGGRRSRRIPGSCARTTGQSACFRTPASALRGQVPLLVLMVGYTLGGLWLLWNG